MRINVGTRAGRWIRGLLGALAVLALAACGEASEEPRGSDTPRADTRNGDYNVYAANGQEYVLTLDFDKTTYRMSRDGFSDSGSIGSGPNGMFFAPTGSVTTAATTARFVQANEAVTGGFPFPGGVLPFVASRLFVKTVADAKGTYNFVARTVDTPVGGIASADTAIFQGELRPDGQLRTCRDLTIVTIAACPATSVVAGTVTVSGDLFTSTTPDGVFPFRVARIGPDNVFLRASVSSPTARRFWIGMPATNAFASGNFSGANTDGDWSKLTFSSGEHSALLTTPTGAAVARGGTAQAFAPGTLGSLLALTTTSGDRYFAVRSAELAAVVSAPGSTTAPGYLDIGKRQ